MVFLYGLLALATKAAVALFVLFKMLRYANKGINVKMEDIVLRLEDDPQALASYYGRRLIAAAIVVLGVSIGSL